MTTINNTTNTAFTSANDFIMHLWNAGSKIQAKQMEEAARNSNPLAKIVSLRTEELLEGYIGHAPSVVSLKSDIRKLAMEQDSVLVIGPTGTGKELVARALHDGRSGKFIGINCTALPAELLESELFGHKKGSFTGATYDRRGKFQEAWGGTLFLDEIGDMPLTMQAKLLRVLQEKEYSPLGGEEIEKVNCRVVAATNKTTTELLTSAAFREDLYYRLAIFTLQTVALTDRREDLAELVDYLGGHELYTELSKCVEPAETYLQLSGNVRSLQAQIRRWQVLGR